MNIILFNLYAKYALQLISLADVSKTVYSIYNKICFLGENKQVLGNSPTIFVKCSSKDASKGTINYGQHQINYDTCFK